MGAPGRTARRLKAGLAALFLITLAAALAPQDAQAQEKPELTATAGVGSVTLNWTRTGNTGFGYWVYRQGVTGGGYGEWIDIPGGTTIRTHTVTGLTAGTSYTFQVARAEGTGINFSVFASGGGFSNGASATPTEATTTAVPAAPTGLTASGAGTTQVLLTWTKPAGTITGYKLRYAKTPAKASATWAAMAGSGANTVRHMVTSLEDDAQYSFMIRAVNASGDGAATGWVTATPADSCPSVLSPTNLSLVPRSDGFAVTWTAPTDVFRNGWTFSYGKTGESSTSVTISNAAATSRTLTGLDADTEYEISLTATHSTYNPSAVCPPGFRVKAIGTTLAAASAGVTLSKTSLTVEEGSSETYTVKLDKAPTADVTITVGGASGDVSVMGSPLTFTPGNFGTAQTITVSAAHDGDTTDDTATLTHAASSTDASYGASLDIDDVDVTVTDTTPTFQLLTDPAAVTEGTDISLTVTSDRSISGNWSVRLTLAARSSSTFTAADIAGTLGPREFTANFGSTNASTTGTVTIPTSTDSATEGAEAYRITLSERTTNVTYAVGTDATADGTLNDAAATGPTITLTAAPGDGQVTLSWTYTNDDGEDFDHWRYAQKKGGGSYSGLGQQIPGGKAIRTHTVTGLENGAAYTFKVTRGVTSPPPARIQTTAPPYSNEVTATPAGSPAKPTGLSAEAGNGQVELTWTDPGDDSITGYQVQQRKGSAAWESWSDISDSDADTVSHTVTGLDNDSEYRFRVRAQNSGGNSARSAVVRATPTPTPDPGATVSTAALTVAEGSSGTYTVRLNTAPSSDVTVTVGGASGDVTVAPPSLTFTTSNWDTPKTVTVSAGTDTDTNTDPDVTLTHSASGGGYGSVSIASVVVSVAEKDAAPAKPAGLAAAAGNGSATLSWTDPDNPTITKWQYRQKAGSGDWGAWTDIPGSGAGTTSHEVSGLTGGTAYQFEVRAVNGAGNGPGPDAPVRVTPAASDGTPAPAGAGRVAAPALTAAASRRSALIALTWTHAGSSASGLVSGAVRFGAWEAAVRLKGARTWETAEFNTQPGRNIATRNDSIGVAFYPDGASVEVRIRAWGHDSTDMVVNGPWSNIRTVTIQNTNTAALTITGAPVMVTAGATAIYTVALTKAYAGTLSITSDDTDKATVRPARLTFTTGNYNTGQTVTVTGVAAGAAAINHAFRLTGASADAIPDAGAVSVMVNAASTAPARPTGFTATGGNQQAVLSWTNPNDARITKWQYSQDGIWKDVPGSSAATTTWTVTGLTPGTAYAFRVRAVNEAGAGAPSPVEVVSTRTPGSVTVSRSTLTMTEGGSGSYTIVLDRAPDADVVVTVGGATGEVTVSPKRLTFTTGNWDTAQTVTVNSGRDEDTAPDTATLTHSARGGGYDSVEIAAVAVTVTDTTPTLQLLTDPAAVMEGTAISLTVTSDKAVPGTLPVSLTLAARGSSGFDADDITGTLGPRMFTVSFDGLRGTVTIPTQADRTREGPENYAITLNDAAGYAVGTDATAGGVLNDGPTGAVGRANRVNAAVLPQVAAAMTGQTLDALTSRIEAVASGAVAEPFEFGSLPASPNTGPGPDRWAFMEPDGPRLSDLLAGAAFHMPLAAQSTATGAENQKPRAAVWGRGARTAFSGAEDDVSWDGSLWSGHLGGDLRLRPDLLVGAAVSHARSETDAETEGVKSVHEAELTAVHPYAAWMPRAGLLLWASAGYGAGEVRITEENEDPRAADLTLTRMALGGRGRLAENQTLIAGGTTRIGLRGEGSFARARTEGSDGLEKLTVDASRLRLAIEGSHERDLDGGLTLTPALEAGLRYDIGDAAEGAGIEAGGSLTWYHPNMGLTVALRGRALLVHEADRDEWGLSALLRLDPGPQGEGTFLTLAPGHGKTGGELDGLFDRMRGPRAAGPEPAGRLEAEVGHGYRLARNGAILTPYAALALAEHGDRALRLGLRYKLAATLSLALEAQRREGAAADDDNGVMIEGAFRW